MRFVLTVSAICLLAFASFARAQGEPAVTGKSATGAITWEIRPPANDKDTGTIWLWPGNHKEKATQLGGAQDAPPIDLEFSKDDAWIIVSRHLSSGNFFNFYRKGADGNYAADPENEPGDDPVRDFSKTAKTVPKDRIDRWSAGFDGWEAGAGPAAFRFSWTARLNKGPDHYFMSYEGWKGVYDLRKHAIVKVLSPGKVFTQTELSESDLNKDYGNLRNLLDAAGKGSLRTEQREWLKKRDALPSPGDKLELTMARVSELEVRLSNLKK
jgi:hypothetical protein